MRRIAVPALVAVLVVLGLATTASAHTSLKGSDPADGARLSEAPTSVRLTFSGPVLQGPSRITVTGPKGETWQRPDTLSVDEDAVSTRLARLGPAGEYTVSYRVVSRDGHPVSGKIGFTLTEPAGQTPAASASSAVRSPDTAPPTAAASSAGQSRDTEPRAAATRAGDGGVGIWPWLAGAGALVCGLLVLLVRRGRASSQTPTDSQ